MEKQRDEILKIVGNNIKNIRKSKGYTQESFAEELGKSINIINNISAFIEKDKEIIFNLIKYIEESKEY